MLAPYIFRERPRQRSDTDCAACLADWLEDAGTCAAHPDVLHLEVVTVRLVLVVRPIARETNYSALVQISELSGALRVETLT